MNEPGSLQENLTAVRAGRRPAVVWGAGQTFLAIQPMFDFPIAKLVDGDPRKWGTTVAGLQVEPPAALGSLAKDAPVVFICSLDPGVTEAIAGELARLDIHQWQAADSRSDLLVELAGGWVERAPASVEAHYQLGRACQLAARSAIWARGVQAYEWVVGHDPANAEAWFALATLQSNGGHDGVAADLFRQVLRLAPAHARAHQGLSECLANLGDREGAMYHLREAAMLSQDIAARAVEDLADLAAPPRRKRKAPVARYPTKAELDGDLLAAIRAKLLSPFDDSHRFLAPSTRIFTIGSCFANNIARALRVLGYDTRLLPLGETINSTFANRYLIDWIAGCPIPPAVAERIEPLVATICSREKLAEDLAGSDVCIFTLGVAACFFDAATGGFIMPRPSALNTQVLADQYLFRTTTVAENTANVLRMIQGVRSLNPAMRIFLTVSPVPLFVSFEQKSPVQADCLSKSTLRVTVNEVLQQVPDNIQYWPSFEMVRWLGGHIDPVFGGDDGNSRHVNESFIGMIMDLFVETFAVKNERVAR